MSISAQNDELSTFEDVTSPYGGDVLQNDSSPAGGLTVVAVNGSSSSVGGNVVGQFGTLVLSGNGSFSFRLSNGANTQSLGVGEKAQESFTYTVRNAAGEQAVATLTVTINGVNDVPTARADGWLTPRGASGFFSGNLLSNDLDVDGDALSVVSVGGRAAPGALGATFGTLSFDSSGAYSYSYNVDSPSAHLHEGEIHIKTHDYVITDGNGGFASSFLRLHIRGYDGPPDHVLSSASALPIVNSDKFATAQLANGNSMVFWGRKVGFADHEFLAQVVDQSGEPVGTPYVMQVAGRYQPGALRATELSGGGVVAVWDYNNRKAAFQTFDSAGQPVGNIGGSISSARGDGGLAPTPAALSNGGFVIVWHEIVDNVKYIMQQVHNAAGEPVGSPREIAAVGRDSSDPTAIKLADGGFALAWLEAQGFDQPRPIKLQTFDSAGASTGALTTVGFAAPRSYEIGGTALEGGKLLLSWLAGSNDAMGKVVDLATGASTAEFRIVGDAYGIETGFQMTPTADGGFAAAWRDMSGGSGMPLYNAVRVQIFDAGGNRIGGSFEVRGPSSSTFLGTVSLDARSDGSLAVYWSDGVQPPGGDLTWSLKMRSVSYDSTPHHVLGYSAADTVVGDDGQNWLAGLDGDDRLDGRGGNDNLEGGKGNDILIGGSGADAMRGGAGNDTYYVDEAGDEVIERAGEGTDRVSASTSYTLRADSEVEVVEASDWRSTDALNLGGSDTANTIIGNEGVNFLYGNGGNDILHAFGGDDFLIGGTGDDAMYGGAGNDTYYIDSPGDRIYENAGEGYDRVAPAISYTLPDNAEIELIEAISLTATDPLDFGGSNTANTIIGNNGANMLRGHGGNDVLHGFRGDDVLDGGAGDDSMNGGAGNDTYYVDSTGDRVNEAAGEGFDRVAAIVSVTLPENAEIELLEAVNLSSTDRMDLGGSDHANTIAGNAGVNFLYGYGGNDILWGYGGDDYLVGGTGNDVMHGGTGNDTYYVDSSGDSVIEATGEGYDRIATTVSLELGGGSEVEVLEAVNFTGTEAMNLTGSDFANTIIGNAGVNVINGRGGSDVLTGGGGADTFEFTTALGAGNVDRITDFETGADRIALGGPSGQPFAALPAGQLSQDAFVVGSQATSSSHRIVYNPQTGALSYDADGSGGTAAIQFATLSTGLALTAAHFTVAGGSASQQAIGSTGLKGDLYDAEDSPYAPNVGEADPIVGEIALASGDYFFA